MSANPFESAIQKIRQQQDIKRQRQEPSTQPAQPPPQPPMNAKILLLPICADAMRCMPNEIVRSALFNARNHKQRRVYFEDVEIAVIGEGRISFRGQELRQNDQTVWLQLIHLAKLQPLGDVVEFTPYSFCKSIGWAIDGRNYARLQECLTRMQATSLSIYSSRLKKSISLSMIPEFTRQDENGRALSHYQVQVAPELVELFGNIHYTQVEWEQRLALPTGISTWLHGYYASHKAPYPIRIETIKAGAGITTERDAKVRELIDRALAQLVHVKFLASYKIIGELAYVKRT